MASPVPNDKSSSRNPDPKKSDGPDAAAAAANQTNEGGNPQADTTHEQQGQRTQKEPPGSKPVPKK